MRAFTYTILAMIFTLSGCSSQKKLVKNHPFELGQATCQTWVGGRPESGSGINLEIPVSNSPNEKMQQAYFREKVATVKLNTVDGKLVAKASFLNANADKPDIVMHSDGTKEVGNQPPKLQEKSPFEMADDECVISYLDGDKMKYFKIEGVKEKEPLIYK